jgi:hypothetical protein
MNRRSILSLSAISAVGFALLPGSAVAQQKTLEELIIGTWSLVFWEQTYHDGRKDQAFGANPKGINAFDASGRFTSIFLRPDLPKLASNDRVKPTPEEAMAIAKGAIVYYGTYTVNEAEKSISLNIEGTNFPNQMGIAQNRIVTTISADELKYRNLASTSGSQIEHAFKRIK